MINLRVILADDQKDVRSGLRILLEQEMNLCIEGEAAELGSLISQVREKAPDLVLLDWELSNMKMADFIPLLKLLKPDLKIIALSSRPEAAKSAITAGVDAFVSKGDHPEKLLDTIRVIGKRRGVTGDVGTNGL